MLCPLALDAVFLNALFLDLDQASLSFAYH